MHRMAEKTVDIFSCTDFPRVWGKGYLAAHLNIAQQRLQIEIFP